VAPRASEGEEERDRPHQATVAGWRAGENPPQAAGAGRTHRRNPREEWRRGSTAGRSLSAAAVALIMILAFIDHVAGAPTMLSLEVLTMANRLARKMGTQLEAVAIGPKAVAAAEVLSSYGASTLHVADDQRLDDYAPAAWAHAVADLAARVNPRVIIGTASDRGGEVIAHVATRMTMPMAANSTEIVPGDPFTVTRQRRGGWLLAGCDQPRLAAAQRPGRPDRDPDRAGPLHRVRDQRCDPAHGRLPGGQAHPRDQHGSWRADRGPGRLRRDRRRSEGARRGQR